MRLHNLHGLSMARRFQGAPDEAVRLYRQLIHEVEYKLSPLTQGKAGAGTEAEPLLYERLVNSIERLGDCNLFGPSQSRDSGKRATIIDVRRRLASVSRAGPGPADCRPALQAGPRTRAWRSRNSTHGSEA
ncbi:MAG: hypothetical protein QM713_17680 [Arachnia sp.]